ncbi:MFS transporter [Raoultella sp. BIGb0399]|uniref:OFA family MFS transporter n=1 Tax=Raoultella sp. BIGb0399 TaxID=2485119 RepID=UPI000F4BD470|nr:OFA family MFS transporter [Raoultella sp. BIGb0399]ROS07962.1 MFS transporter [Raoultella sp. BIGb0399]
MQLSNETPINHVSFFSKKRIIAKPGFNRWLVPPAALAIHLCIGMAYGFSVFWLPMSNLIGKTCAPESSVWQQLFTTTCDWRISLLGWTYTLFFIFLGCSAALWGQWLEKVGPRKVGMVATFSWCGGLLLAALAINQHQLWLLWLGAGAIGGIGLGLGYISPVSTLLRWFPDKRGMAAGMAIMGFGGGAMIGAPFANKLMAFYAEGAEKGVWQTLLTLAAIYFIFMLAGTLSYRLPPMGWKPRGWQPSPTQSDLNVHYSVHVSVACKTRQFWLLWLVLCLNVTAGIGILGMASPMLQEVFAGKLLGNDLSWQQLDAPALTRVAAVAAGFTGLLSLFNIGGRFFWASISDYLGRKKTFTLFFVLGAILYLLTIFAASSNSLWLFVLTFCIIISMYGGGFATIPAYLADQFGTQMVGAIHGRLLTAWSAAGIFGPVLVNYLREYQLAQGVAPARIYDVTLYSLAALLCVGFICNILVTRVPEKYAMSDEELKQAASTYKVDPNTPLEWQANRSSYPWAVLAWLVVMLPLLWGIAITLQQSIHLFT